MSKWISVKERLPEKEGAYLIYTDECETLVAWCEPGGFWRRSGDLFPMWHDEITHWMPLPEPPVVVAENATASEEG